MFARARLGSFFHPGAGVLAALALAALLPTPAAAQGGCPKCVNDITCTLVPENTMNGPCTVEPSGCTAPLGICVVGDLGGHGFALKHRESRKVVASDGPVRLAAVGERYFAAWSCTGEVRHLYKESEAGEMIRIRDRFAMARYRAPQSSGADRRPPSRT